MKKILFTIIILLFPVMFVSANSVQNIDMDIYLDKQGNAHVTETWQAYVNSGTEGYHPYFNIGNATLTDLNVSMDGKKFATVDSWNVNGNLEDKAYKAGFYHTGNEIDVCFGITSYGTHTYVVKYNINGFVTKVKDADMVYWTLFPYDFSASPNNIHIKIHSDFKYDDTFDVWGYGNYGGTAYVYDGYIEMNTNNGLSSNEYMTILIKFPVNTFETTNILDNDFKYYHDMAEKGATHYNKKQDNVSLKAIFNLIKCVIWFLVLGFITIRAINKSGSNYRYGTVGNKVRKDVPNFREIPCNKDIYRAYFVANKYNLIKKKEDFLGAILLKWLKNGNVSVEKVEKKGLFKTETINNIIFNNPPKDIGVEVQLYDWMNIASKDGKLESNEFEKWCKNNYDQILKWFDSVIEYERSVLTTEGKIKVTEEVKAKIFKNTYYDVDPSMMQEAEQLKGLKNYLKEFTIINQREPIEVQLWNEYLMFAQIFGIADKVAEQFKKLYPEITEVMDNLGYDYGDLIFINTISSRGMSSANTARAESYSSGGGGFSSGGGGGGSFGGGGGGGGFR